MIRLIFLVLVYACFFLLSCAKMEQPSGGPEDKVAPKILKTYPENKALFFKEDEILITFSKEMSERTVKEAITTVPPNFFRQKKWRGNTLVLEPSKPYAVDHTYTITISTSARDLHGNALEKQFILVFSSGKTIADGQIAGNIVWKYAEVNDLKNGRINLTSLADSSIIYNTATDSTGAFTFDYLAREKYRLEAYIDKDSNQKYTDTKEPGIIQVVDITTGNRNTLELELALNDTVPSKLDKVISLDRENLLVRFDEEMKMDSLASISNWMLSPADDTLKTIEIYSLYGGETKSKDWFFRVMALDGGKKYRMLCKYAKDQADNVSKNITYTFEASSKVDSVRLKVDKIEPASGKAGVSIKSTILLSFNREIKRETLEKAFLLKTQIGSEITSGSWSYPHILEAEFKPLFPLAAKMQYTVYLDTTMLDYRGWQLGSKFESSFYTEVSDEPGSITGQIIYRQTNSPIIVSLSKGSAWTMTTSISKPGPYEIKKVPPGIYTVNAFLDVNKNGKLDVGESFGSFKGVAIVKSGLATPNIDITLFP
jgi:hypothetical protein